jgi:hypothetical protein
MSPPEMSKLSELINEVLVERIVNDQRYQSLFLIVDVIIDNADKEFAHFFNTERVLEVSYNTSQSKLQKIDDIEFQEVHVPFNL